MVSFYICFETSLGGLFSRIIVHGWVASLEATSIVRTRAGFCFACSVFYCQGCNFLLFGTTEIMCDYAGLLNGSCAAIQFIRRWSFYGIDCAMQQMNECIITSKINVTLKDVRLAE